MATDTMYTVTIEGIRPLIMHNGRLADPLDEFTIKLKELTKKRDKSPEDHVEIQQAEWLGGLYFDPKLGPYIPTDNLQAVIERGATKRKLGKLFKAHVGVDLPTGGVDGYALTYKGPRDVTGLWEARKEFVFNKGVKVTGKRIMRTRARFAAGWGCTFKVEVLANGVTKAQLQQAIEDAGIYEGLGDWRPRYGRFTVKSIS